MTLYYLLEPNDGFTVGDTETGLTAYAYPSSYHAKWAEREPATQARDMLRNESDLTCLRDPATPMGQRAIAQDKERLKVLRKRGVAIDAPNSAPPSLANPAPCEATEQGLQYVIPGAERRLPPTRAGGPRKRDERQSNLF